eukprot:m.268792 g.268792  ORF g.268792 m.268792 type:complete len:187 (-) comp15662_c0_seq4:1847-2407(-)
MESSRDNSQESSLKDPSLRRSRTMPSLTSMLGTCKERSALRLDQLRSARASWEVGQLSMTCDTGDAHPSPLDVPCPCQFGRNSEGRVVVRYVPSESGSANGTATHTSPMVQEVAALQAQLARATQDRVLSEQQLLLIRKQNKKERSQLRRKLAGLTTTLQDVMAAHHIERVRVGVSLFQQPTTPSL